MRIERLWCCEGDSCIVQTQSDETKSTTLLVSSHDLNHVTEVCDRIVLLEKGKAVKDIPKTAKTLKELEAYFSGQ